MTAFPDTLLARVLKARPRSRRTASVKENLVVDDLPVVYYCVRCLPVRFPCRAWCFPWGCILRVAGTRPVTWALFRPVGSGRWPFVASLAAVGANSDYGRVKRALGDLCAESRIWWRYDLTEDELASFDDDNNFFPSINVLKFRMVLGAYVFDLLQGLPRWVRLIAFSCYR